MATEYVYKLSNGKELVLKGDSAPSDDEVESIAKEQGVSLALAEEAKADFSNVQSDSTERESEFQNWYKDRSAKFNLDPNPDSPEHFYDYRAAHQAGAEPDKDAHWPSEYKKEGHPNLIVDGINTKTGLPDKASMRRKLGYGRQDEQTFDLDKLLEGTNKFTNSISNKIGQSDWIPDIAKGTLATGAALLPEMANVVASAISDPTLLAGSSTVLRSITKPKAIIPPVIPPVVPKPKFRMKLDETGKNVGYDPIPPANLEPDLSLPVSDMVIPPNPNKTTITMGGKTVDISGMEDKSALEALGITSKSPLIQRVIKEEAKVLESQGAAPIVANTASEVAIKVPELAPVVKDPNFIRKFLTAFDNRRTGGSRLTAALTSSMDSEYMSQSPRLGEITKIVQTDSHVKAGGWIADYDNLTEPLSDTQFANFVDAIEGKAQPSDDKVIAALAEYRKLDEIIQGEATQTKMGLRSSDGSKTVPWVGRAKYWPHMYTKEFFETLKHNPTDVVAQLTKAGKSPQEIQDLLSNSQRYGERLVDAQHAREADLPGYRVDRDVYRQHIAEMARRITEAKNYGPMDLADAKSPIMDIIRETKNPEYATKLMMKQLGRSGVGDRDTIDFSRKLVGAQAWLHLSMAGISNLNSFAMTPIQTNFKSFVGGFADSIFQSKQSGEFAKRSGAIQNIFREIFAASIDDTKRFMPTKVYGIDAGERWMRTVSANAGKRYTNELFEEMKAGNANPQNLKKLQELTLTNPAELSLQTELTEHQLKRAAFRVGELSQGLAEMQNMPEHWTGSGIANILTLFHKYQFAQTKVVKDLLTTGSVKQNLRNAAMLIGASQIAGEITGDAKAFVKGTVKAGYSQDTDKIYDEIANRGDYVAENFGLEDSPLMSRFIENTLQSFALGMYSSVIEAMSGSGGDAIIQLAGSTAGDLAKVWDMGKDLAEGDLEGAATKGISAIPIVGPPIASEMREEATMR